MNALNMNTSAKRLLLGGVAILGVVALAGCGGGGGTPAATGVITQPTQLSLATLKAGDSVPAGTYTITGDRAEIAAIYAALVARGSTGIPATTVEAGGIKLRCSGAGCGIEIDEAAETITVTGTIEVAATDGRFPSERPSRTPTVNTGATNDDSKDDDDDMKTPVVSLSAAMVNAPEGPTARITVTLTAPAPTGGLTVSYTLDGTAGTVTVPATRTSHTFDVPITGQAVGQTLDLALVDDDDDGYDLGTVRTSTITIVMPGTTPTVMFSTASMTVAEDGTPTIAVSISPAPTTAFTLSYTVTGGDAAQGTDFTTPGTVNIGVGDTSVNIPVAITDDSATESAETLVLTLTPGTGYTLGSTGVFTLTITDNDGPPPPPPNIEVGTGGLVTNGDLDIGRVKGALVGFTPGSDSINAPIPSLPSDASHWGVWLSEQNDLIVWYGAPAGTYDQEGQLSSAFVTDIQFDTAKTANYRGSVRGLGHHESGGTESFGEFTAAINLTASFAAVDSGSSSTLAGTVSGWSGSGADSAWGTVNLNNDGTVSGGAATGGEWGHYLYRQATTGDPDGATGYVDLNFADISEANGGGTESAIGAFHAIKQQ